MRQKKHSNISESRALVPIKSPEAYRPIENTLPNAGLSFSWMPIADLVRAKREVRIHPRRQIEQICASMKQFGFVTPLIAGGKDELIAGDARLTAAELLGLTHVPVVHAHNLTEAQIRAFRIADARLSEKAEWDPIALKTELAEITLLAPDIDIEAMGFEIPEFDVAIGYDPPPKADAPVEVPGTPISQLGDIFDVEGEGHVIGCGDARDPSVIASVLGHYGMASLLASDPPFNVSAKSIGGKGKIKHPDFKMARGEMSPEQYTTFLAEAITAWLPFLTPGALLYLAIDWRHNYELETAAKMTELEHINMCIWEKAPGMGSFYRSAHEIWQVYRKPGAGHRNNIMLGMNGRSRSNIWSYPGAASFGSTRKELGDHPSPKPVALMGDLIKDSTARGEVVLDPFGGGGSTLIAAQAVGRIGCTIELDPRYVDVIVRRYERVFGKAPVHRETGLTLGELGEQRKIIASQNDGAAQ